MSVGMVAVDGGAAAGKPLARWDPNGVLVLFGMRAGSRALGDLFGLLCFDGVAFGGAGK
jgi:hypothetical protein